MIRTFVSIIAVVFFSSSAFALEKLPQDARVILTVTGAITHTNADARAGFDHDSFAALGWVDVTSFNHWLPGEHQFGGVLISDILAAVGAANDAHTLKVTALDGYSVDIPIRDFDARNVLLASTLNGERMRIRDRGPLWVIYPVSEDRAKESDEDGKQIWQVKSMHVAR